MELMDILTLVQTIAIFAALIFTAYQILLQRKDSKDEAYRRILEDWRQVEIQFANKPEISNILTDLGVYPKLYPEDKKVQYNYLQMHYEILEWIYCLHDEKTITEEEWWQWNKWLTFLSKHPVFIDVHKTSTNMFDEDFQKYVQKIIDSNEIASDPSTPAPTPVIK